MSKPMNCIMLVDDNPDDNFFHERVIRKCNAADIVIVKESAEDALSYLKADVDNKIAHPDLIFLDINMPRMNGWQFLQEYRKLSKSQQSKLIVIMITSFENPDDHSPSITEDIAADFKTKPLTPEKLSEVIEKYFWDKNLTK